VIETVRIQNERLIILGYIVFRYVITIVGFAALTAFAKWCVADDHISYANAAFDWTFIAFYTAITAIFVLHIVLFIFWRNR
jgi:hypothetical protein